MLSKDVPYKDRTNARYLLGYYEEELYKETIVLEYRLDNEFTFHLFCRIRGVDYSYSDSDFFEATAWLLDQLPTNSKLVFRHQVPYEYKGDKKIGILDEIWFHDYDRFTKERLYDTGTVVYKLIFHADDVELNSGKQFSFADAAEELRNQFPKDFHISVCYYCELLIDYSSFGGTDFRHDLLFCFRDRVDLYKEVVTELPKLYSKEPLLVEVPGHMDALHSCPAFKYKERSRL